MNISAREVHDNMGLANQFPAVCEAIDAKKFLAYAHVELIDRKGPRESTTVEWKFQV